MRLLLIRHGETVDNVAGKYAGITDSALTTHGVLQANKLGMHLAATDVEISHIFSSDLQRAARTAEAILAVQPSASLEVTKLQVLREQDFGFYEGKRFSERPRNSNKSRKGGHLEAHRNDEGFKDVESKQSMALRMGAFVDMHLIKLLEEVNEEHVVAIVAHGIILSYLWREILNRFQSANISVAPSVIVADRGLGLENLGGWDNTGYLDLEVKAKFGEAPLSKADEATAQASSTMELALPLSTTTAQPLLAQARHMTLVVKAVNSKEHLDGLKKTRGGIGSLKHDSSQKTMDSFFNKKRRTE